VALRFFAAPRACLDNAVREAAERPSRLSAFSVARERFADVFFLPALPFAKSRVACLRTFSELFPLAGG
jgi:hypothetical protein